MIAMGKTLKQGIALRLRSEVVTILETSVTQTCAQIRNGYL